MTDRTYPFDPEQACDECGAIGAFDIMGDYLCSDCINAANDDSDVDVYEEV